MDYPLMRDGNLKKSEDRNDGWHVSATTIWI